MIQTMRMRRTANKKGAFIENLKPIQHLELSRLQFLREVVKVQAKNEKQVVDTPAYLYSQSNLQR